MATKKIKLPKSKKEITGRTPKVKDMKLVKHIDNDMDREFALIGNLCEMTPEEVEDLEMKDYEEIQKVLLL